VVTSKIGSLSGFLSQPGSERTSRRITAKVNRCRNAFIYPANRKIGEPWRPSPIFRAENSADSGSCLDYLKLAGPTREHQGGYAVLGSVVHICARDEHTLSPQAAEI